jgi:hypothetical protein
MLLHHSQMHQYQYQTVVEYWVRRVLELSISDALDHQMIIVVPLPMQMFPYKHPCHLAEGPCNMGESQHEPSVEVTKSQEAPKLG